MQMLLTHQTITQRAGMSSGSTVATVKVASLKVTIHLCRQKSNPCIKLSALRSLCVEAVYCMLPGIRSSFRQIQLHIISPPRTTVDTGLPRSTHSGCMNPYNGNTTKYTARHAIQFMPVVITAAQRANHISIWHMYVHQHPQVSTKLHSTCMLLPGTWNGKLCSAAGV